MEANPRDPLSPGSDTELKSPDDITKIYQWIKSNHTFVVAIIATLAALAVMKMQQWFTFALLALLLIEVVLLILGIRNVRTRQKDEQHSQSHVLNALVLSAFGPSFVVGIAIVALLLARPFVALVLDDSLVFNDSTGGIDHKTSATTTVDTAPSRPPTTPNTAGSSTTTSAIPITNCGSAALPDAGPKDFERGNGIDLDVSGMAQREKANAGKDPTEDLWWYEEAESRSYLRLGGGEDCYSPGRNIAIAPNPSAVDPPSWNDCAALVGNGSEQTDRVPIQTDRAWYCVRSSQGRIFAVEADPHFPPGEILKITVRAINLGSVSAAR